MILVRLFGLFDVRDATGRPIMAVLRQPKRAALLAYLAASPAGTFHRRDRIVALFWPDTMRIDHRGLLPTAYARLGRRDDARRLSDEIAASSDIALHGLLALWQARIAARLGERERATELLALAFKQGVPHNPLFPAIGGTYWHSDPDLEPLKGYRPFEELVRPR